MSEMTQYIQCYLELHVSGPSEESMAHSTATALRRIADQLEREEFQDGHHDVSDDTGQTIGKVHFDFSEGM